MFTELSPKDDTLLDLDSEKSISNASFTNIGALTSQLGSLLLPENIPVSFFLGPVNQSAMDSSAFLRHCPIYCRL